MQKLGDMALAVRRMLRKALPSGVAVNAVDGCPDGVVEISVPQGMLLLLQLNGRE